MQKMVIVMFTRPDANEVLEYITAHIGQEDEAGGDDEYEPMQTHSDDGVNSLMVCLYYCIFNISKDSTPGRMATLFI